MRREARLALCQWKKQRDVCTCAGEKAGWVATLSGEAIVCVCVNMDVVASSL